jgi:hypothetical protein
MMLDAAYPAADDVAAGILRRPAGDDPPCGPDGASAGEPARRAGRLVRLKSSPAIPVPLRRIACAGPLAKTASASRNDVRMRRFALNIAMSIAVAVVAWLVASAGAHAHGAGHHHAGATAMSASATDAGSAVATSSATHGEPGVHADMLDGHCDGAPAQHAGNGDCCVGFCHGIAHLQGSAPAGTWRARPPRCFERSALLSPMPAATPERPPRFRAA